MPKTKPDKERIDEKIVAADYKAKKIGENSDSEKPKENGEEKTPEVKAAMRRQGVISFPPKTPFIMGSEWAGDTQAALPDHVAWSELIVVYLDAATIIMDYAVVNILLFKLPIEKRPAPIDQHD